MINYHPYKYNLSTVLCLDNDLAKDVYDMIHKQPNIAEFFRTLLLDFYSAHGNVHYYCSIPEKDRLEKFFKKKCILTNSQVAQDILEFMGSGLIEDMDGASAMCAFMTFLANKYPSKPSTTPSPAA